MTEKKGKKNNLDRFAWNDKDVVVTSKKDSKKDSKKS